MLLVQQIQPYFELCRLDTNCIQLLCQIHNLLGAKFPYAFYENLVTSDDIKRINSFNTHSVFGVVVKYCGFCT